MDAEKYRAILSENLFRSARDLRLGQRITFQGDINLKHTTKETQWLRENSGPEPNRGSLERPENGCAQTHGKKGVPSL